MLLCETRMQNNISDLKLCFRLLPRVQNTTKLKNNYISKYSFRFKGSPKLVF